MNGCKTRKIASFVALATVSLLLFLIGFSSFAWFADMKNSENLGFGAGTLDNSVLEIAKIVHDGNSAGTLGESDRRYYPCDDMRIEADSLPTENGEGYTVDMDKMSFGLIDSIAFLKPDNVVYFRLTVPKRNGDTVNFKFEYNVDGEGNFVEMYKNGYDTNGDLIQEKIENGETIEGETVSILEAFQSVETVEDKKDCFIKYSVCLSNDSYEASELSSLTFYGEGGKEASETSDTHYRFNSFENSEECVTLVNDKIDEAGEFYYVYVKVEPNLDVFGRSIEHISSIMPCYVYFKTRAYFEIH